MPKKKGGKKKKGKKKKLPGNETPDQVVKRLLKAYERNCFQSKCAMSPGLKASLKESVENEKLLTKFVVEPVSVSSADDPVVLLEPLVAAIRQEHYHFMTDLYVWDLPMSHEHLASLALLVEKGCYPIKHLELMDCLIQPEQLQRLSLSFNACTALSSVVLDYNEFGDAGCAFLSNGFHGNRTIISLSMNYCDLQPPSGKILGRIVSITAVRELYLDGNDLGCEGAVDLIKVCADYAETETYQREQEEKRKEEEALAQQMERDGMSHLSSGAEDKSGSAASKKGKKKKVPTATLR